MNRKVGSNHHSYGKTLFEDDIDLRLNKKRKKEIKNQRGPSLDLPKKLVSSKKPNPRDVLEYLEDQEDQEDE